MASTFFFVAKTLVDSSYPLKFPRQTAAKSPRHAAPDSSHHFDIAKYSCPTSGVARCELALNNLPPPLFFSCNLSSCVSFLSQFSAFHNFVTSHCLATTAPTTFAHLFHFHTIALSSNFAATAATILVQGVQGGIVFACSVRFVIFLLCSRQDEPSWFAEDGVRFRHRQDGARSFADPDHRRCSGPRRGREREPGRCGSSTWRRSRHPRSGARVPGGRWNRGDSQRSAKIRSLAGALTGMCTHPHRPGCQSWCCRERVARLEQAIAAGVGHVDNIIERHTRMLRRCLWKHRSVQRLEESQKRLEELRAMVLVQPIAPQPVDASAEVS